MMFSSIAKASRSLRTGFRGFSTTRSILSTAEAEHGDTFGSALKVDNYNTKIKRQPQLRKETNTKVLKHILHCKFRKNNTFLTLTNVEVDMNYEHNHPEKSFNEKVLYYLTLPERVILSQSTGYLGFRKAQRGEYEAAFQLTSHIFKIIRERNILDDCFNLEIVVSDFGKGRKAFFDALKGKEGSSVRPALSKLTDMTKLKFGGVRSPSRRRI